MSIIKDKLNLKNILILFTYILKFILIKLNLDKYNLFK